jgi:adenine-specific DNA-methyltransferase
MNKLTQDDATSHDIIAANINELKAIFPEAFTEGKVDFDVLKETLGEYREKREERYNFSWAGKSKARRLAQTPTTGTLRPCPEESVDWDKTENLFIEGDNLEVLKLLQKSYQGQVKMIYIDPPYNTGGDFVYPDKYADNLKGYLEYTNQVDAEGNKQSTNTEASGRYHSNWLNMMLPRLHLAKNLLRKDGVIFVSIDDNEITHLRKLLDEVFGEENFLAQMIVNTGANQSGDGVIIQTNTEYCLVYAKDASAVVINRIDKVDESLRNLNDAPTPLETRKDMGYTIYYNPETEDIKPEFDYDKSKIELNKIEEVYQDNAELVASGYVPIRPGFRNNRLHRWRWGYETFIERLDEVVVKKSGSSYGAFFKQSGFNAPKNVVNFGSGTTEVNGLFDGEKVFDFPKSSSFMMHLQAIGNAPDGIILDFFSGSCSSAEASLRLNAQDQSKRKFIMVQLPELCKEPSVAYKSGYETIAEVGKERIRRAASKIKETHPDYKGDLGFKVFKLDSSNVEAWDSNIENLEDNVLKAANVLKDDRSELDIVYELFLKYGLDLSYPVNTHEVAGKQVYEIGAGSLFICLEDGITTDFVEGLIKLYESFDDEAAPRVVFKDSGFKTDAAKKDAESTLKDAGILDVKCL